MQSYDHIMFAYIYLGLIPAINAITIIEGIHILEETLAKVLSITISQIEEIYTLPNKSF